MYKMLLLSIILTLKIVFIHNQVLKIKLYFLINMNSIQFNYKTLLVAEIVKLSQIAKQFGIIDEVLYKKVN